MNIYESPQVTVVAMDIVDVIRTSNGEDTPDVLITKGTSTRNIDSDKDSIFN